ncbi:MAG: hypothetical protein OXU66_07530 [Gammaproteobacteria bacterium]|nr:hypothetical protein [Gammaproteobacteria bacterium]MDD9895809.1 hypothetical protein [Gammaproteobacteria bacterium]MDD9958776.1 hypothetical protein [Gammaproteobacteria bacterium]
MALKVRGLVIFGLALAALFSYIVGSAFGLIFFVGAGALFEMMFWFNLFKRKK